MTNRRTKFLVFAAAAFISLLLPAAASAQQGPWGGRNRDDDYSRYGRISDQQRRTLRDVARRISDRSRSFQRNVDRALDRSRIDDTRREDRVNQEVEDFRRAAERFKDRAGESNDLSRSRDEAQRLLNEAVNVDRFIRRVRLDSRATSDWSQIRADLRTVADIYNIRMNNIGNGRNDDNDRDRRDNSRGLPWPRNWPF